MGLNEKQTLKELMIKYGFKAPDMTMTEFVEDILPSVQLELDSEALIRTIEMGITATNSNDIYSLGMRNGMRWCKSLIDNVEPKFEDYVTSIDDWKELSSAQFKKINKGTHKITESDKISYSVICNKFPNPHIYFNTYKEAERWARFNQPNYRPYYIIERSEHFEIVGEVK